MKINLVTKLVQFVTNCIKELLGFIKTNSLYCSFFTAIASFCIASIFYCRYIQISVDINKLKMTDKHVSFELLDIKHRRNKEKTRSLIQVVSYNHYVDLSIWKNPTFLLNNANKFKHKTAKKNFNKCSNRVNSWHGEGYGNFTSEKKLTAFSLFDSTRTSFSSEKSLKSLDSSKTLFENNINNQANNHNSYKFENDDIFDNDEIVNMNLCIDGECNDLVDIYETNKLNKKIDKKKSRAFIMILSKLKNAYKKSEDNNANDLRPFKIHSKQ